MPDPALLSLTGATLVFFLCNLAYWMNPQTGAGKFAAALWWFTAILFLLDDKFRPELLAALPFAFTWGLDFWVRKRTPAWAEKLRERASSVTGEAEDSLRTG